MPEYRRFISYFYEYIDGKKQKNAGFAKVELREGMWRLLLRILADACPSPPIQVYGFARVPGRLQGILLGEMRPVKQIAEEWAFRADAPLGEGKYIFGDLAGIWIESSDGRRFITVWDDEGIDVEHFVTEASQETDYEEGGPEASGSQPMEKRPALSGSQHDEEDSSGQPEEDVAGQPEDNRIEAAGSPDEGEASDGGADRSGEPEHVAELQGQSVEASGDGKTPAIRELLQKRAAFQPFAGAEIESCVMILPCDIVRLQQENWNVGRSSFLQHGFYQYRHLLLGVTGDGTCILGVPGVNNPQEAYMAQMFGYGRFLESARKDSGQVFGYWCRELRQNKS